MTSLPIQLAEAVRTLGVTSIYGDPVQIDGVTLIPVALSWYGFGGGDDGKGDAAAAGGGGGGVSIPVGAYVKTTQGISFQPNLISLLAVSIPVMWVWGHSLSRVVKALKK